ncbi:MAG TPA: PhoPQ-activated protein PqaA family protein [Stellaceae bacterium]|nr:PhoPQ-activated protein PqaA family protein [Stellaceae bacterium]
MNALERYVASPDPSYRWKATAALPGSGYTAHLIELVSQRWRDESEVNRPRWRHQLRLVMPDEIANDTALLVIAGGSNDKAAPARANPMLAIVAMMTRSVSAELRMVPNQPLTFAGETDPRAEDGIIAYSWDKYLRTGDETWPLRLPMTKSVVRAMDAITGFCRSPAGGEVEIARFVLAGASKRGWTAWTAAAVDRRVAAVVPVVIDLLNIETSFEHHYRAYGFWAPAIAAYQASGIMRWAGTAELASLLEIEDPFAYRDRLSMPKFVINSAGDQYFLPDSSRFYFDALIGEKYLRYVPNTDHSLKGSDAWESALAFYHAIVAGQTRPKFSWSFAPDGVIEIETATRPLAAVLWQATNPETRDFRLEAIGPAYRRSTLKADGDGTFRARVSAPARGWTAYFVELTFPSRGPFPFKFTTEIRVAPEPLPFGPPPEMMSIGRGAETRD